MQIDQDIETLLELNGNIVQQEHGHWIEIHVWHAESTSEIPHGIRYALTLHAQDGKRIMGYDNAHAVKHSGKYKHAGQILPYDHKHCHIADKGVPYEFKDAYQLRSDFFADVDRVLKETVK